MSRIPQNFIDELLERTDIVELIDERVNLKKTGRNYSACCPFHEEKTPSFSVSPDKQFYYCFGCGAGGNALSFLMDYERLEFLAAVENLAHKAGLEIPKEQNSNPKQEQQQRNLYNTLQAAAEFYQQQLRHHAQRQQAVNYLKQRGLDGHIVQHFSIGYAPPGWDNLLKQQGKNPAEIQRLLDSGMLIVKDDASSQYDRFRQRIMFPIRDTRGRVIAFGGRVLGDDKPKYLNSPETSVFHKSRELYGLYEARQSNKNLSQIIIVEGYMDVVALAQFGITYAVATLGTATTAQHLEKLFRYTNELVFCFDGDKAGRAAADKALNAALPLMLDGRQIKFLFLPEGDDPDTLVRREGQVVFEQYCREASSLTDYLFAYCQRDIDTRSLDGKARFAKLSMSKIQQLPPSLFKSLNIDALAELTGLDSQRLEEFEQEELTPAPNTRTHDISSKPAQAPEYKPPIQRRSKKNPTFKSGDKAAAKAITLLLNYPQLSQHMPTDLQPVLQDSNSPAQILLLEIQQQLQQNPQRSSYSLLGHWLGSTKFDHLMQLMADNSCNNESIAQQEFHDCLQQILQQQQQQQQQSVIKQLRQQKKQRLADLPPSQQQHFLQIFKKKSETE